MEPDACGVALDRLGIVRACARRLVLRRPAGLYAFAHGRAVGIFENPNELALYALAVCTIAAAAMFAHYRGRRLAIATFVLGALALIATGRGPVKRPF